MRTMMYSGTPVLRNYDNSGMMDAIPASYIIQAVVHLYLWAEEIIETKIQEITGVPFEPDKTLKFNYFNTLINWNNVV